MAASPSQTRAVGAHPFPAELHVDDRSITREAKSNFGPKLRDARGKLAVARRSSRALDDWMEMSSRVDSNVLNRNESPIARRRRS